MKTSFLCLPNEILTKFFENLSMRDRQSLASINNRLREIERKSGHRQFDSIVFNKDSDGLIIATIASDRKTFSRSDSPLEVAVFFNHASTQTLKISGPMDNESEMMLDALSRALSFEKLILLITDERSCGAFNKLIQQRQLINQLDISLNEDLIHLECAKHLLMNLPQMKNFQLFPTNFLLHQFLQSKIDDEVLLHLIGSCSECLSLNYSPTRLTTSGIAKAFEAVCNSRPNLAVSMHMPTAEFDLFFRSLRAVERIFKVNYCIGKHIDSGAILECDNNQNYGTRFITMRGRDSPMRFR